MFMHPGAIARQAQERIDGLTRQASRERRRLNAEAGATDARQPRPNLALRPRLTRP